MPFFSTFCLISICFFVQLSRKQEFSPRHYIDGKWRAIVRFDAAHGFFHKDIMSPTGDQQKIAQISFDKKLALNEAIDDIKGHWASYRKEYEVKYYEKK